MKKCLTSLLLSSWGCGSRGVLIKYPK